MSIIVNSDGLLGKMTGTAYGEQVSINFQSLLTDLK